MRYALYRGFRKAAATLRSRSVALSLLATAVLLVFFQFITSLNMYVIFDGDELTVHQSYASDAETALAEAGIRINRDDFVFLPNAAQNGVMEIHIERSQTVILDVYGETRQLSTLGTTVGDVLTRVGLTLDGQDKVEPDLSTPVTDGMTIAIWRHETRVDVVTEEIPYDVERVPLNSLLEGKEEVAQEGSPGEMSYYYEISLRNGVETDSRLIAESVTVPKQDTIIHYGVKKPDPPSPSPPPPSPPPPSPPPSPSPTPTPKTYYVREDAGETGEAGVLISSSGEEVHYTKVLNVTATAYTTERQSNKLTYMGTTARFGAIAVDPRVIPLGTRVYVEVPGGQWYYGFATCEDTGGAIKGYIIDLFFNTYDECVQFGRRNAVVYILE